MSDLDAMTPADVRAFHRQWYTPTNAVVVVAGDVQGRQRCVPWRRSITARCPRMWCPSASPAPSPNSVACAASP